MNGIVPPSPMNIDGLPKWRCDAADSACSSHGAISGASQPAPALISVNETLAPYGGAFSRAALVAWAAAAAATRGGAPRGTVSRGERRQTLAAPPHAGPAPAPA